LNRCTNQSWLTRAVKGYKVEENLGIQTAGESVKKETILTAAVFLVVGFFAGYFFQAQRSAPATSANSTASSAMNLPPGHPPIDSGTAASQTPTDAGSAAGLPPGHPPIDAAATIRQLEELANQNPQDPQAAVQVANTLYDQHEYEQAIVWYQKAVALDPKNVNARTDMGTSYFLLNRPQDALREYRKSLETDPNHEPTMFNIIVVELEGMHDLQAARRAWEKLNARNPTYPGLDRMKKDLDDAARGMGPAGKSP
jgi:tetratricopeptide (TPR) repeat protein